MRRVRSVFLRKGEGVLLGRCGMPCFRNASYLVPLGSLRVWGSMALWSVFLIRGVEIPEMNYVVRGFIGKEGNA
jgi:hypothetical protein